MPSFDERTHRSLLQYALQYQKLRHLKEKMYKKLQLVLQTLFRILMPFEYFSEPLTQQIVALKQYIFNNSNLFI